MRNHRTRRAVVHVYQPAYKHCWRLVSSADVSTTKLHMNFGYCRSTLVFDSWAIYRGLHRSSRGRFYGKSFKREAVYNIWILMMNLISFRGRGQSCTSSHGTGALSDLRPIYTCYRQSFVYTQWQPRVVYTAKCPVSWVMGAWWDHPPIYWSYSDPCIVLYTWCKLRLCIHVSWFVWLMYLFMYASSSCIGIRQVYSHVHWRHV